MAIDSSGMTYLQQRKAHEEEPNSNSYSNGGLLTGTIRQPGESAHWRLILCWSLHTVDYILPVLCRAIRA